VKSSLKKCISEQIIISTDVLDDIVKRFREVNINAGELLAEPGKVSRNLAFISKGILRMYNVADGKEVTLWIGTENRFITDLRSFVQQKPARWYIETITDCELGVISREDHFNLMGIYPKWLEFDNRLLTSAFSIMEHRLWSHLYMTAEERYRELMETEPGLFNRVPLKMIASMLGIAPETLSRLRKKLIS
jgi:CRP/FNR family transcriptional regulator, anaerobic regulatory protein